MATFVSVSLMNSILAAAKENDDVKAILEKLITEPGLKVVHDDDQRAVDISEQFLYPTGARESQTLLRRVQESAASEDLVTAVKVSPFVDAPNTMIGIRPAEPDEVANCWVIYLKRADDRYYYQTVQTEKSIAEKVAKDLAQRYKVNVVPDEPSSNDE